MDSLESLKPGKVGTIKRIKSKGALKRRIFDMGITPGAQIRMIKTAPMGDPLEVEVRGYRLSLRKSEASEIEISSEVSNENLGIQFLEKTASVNMFLNQDKKKDVFKVALIGNPNSGKTTLFNQLTGSYQYVGNWPGVTVKRKEGRLKNSSEPIEIVDLPGVYSLSPYSPEEVITRNYVLNDNPDLILNIVDSTNLERNLYLTSQLLELDHKIIIALNMTDLLLKKGKIIDIKSLSEDLGVPVIPISASRNKGTDKLVSEILKKLSSREKIRELYTTYPEKVEQSLEKIDQIVNKNTFVPHSRFKNIKIFENDPVVLWEMKFPPETLAKLEKIRDNFGKNLDKEVVIADARYNLICEIYKKNVKETKIKKNTISHKIDKILTGKYTAVPIFLVMIAFIFYVTFGPFGLMLKSLCEKFINDGMAYYINAILEYTHASSWAKDLVLNSVIGGVGSVISFLPQVVLLFTLLSLLEDCGYMARAVFIMDRIFRKIGLSGKAFVPLIMGFGCSVPAVMGTRILENKRDKNLAIFLIPFMSCAAKMPVYMMFAAIFFPHNQTFVVLSLYILGIILAVFTAYLFKNTLFKGESTPFVMEIPEYKWPSLKNLWLHVWDRTKDFVERAGTVILGASIIIWFLQSFTLNFRFTTDSSESILADFGGFLAPIFKICGFGNWQAVVALTTGFMAKESIVSTLSVLYGTANNLTNSISATFTPLSSISFLIFILLYTPCVAAVSAMSKEFENRKLFFISIVYQLFIAFLCSGLVYQFGRLLGF